MDMGFIFSWRDAPVEGRLRQLSWMFTTYLLFGALAAGEADYTHFTWWSQATFTSYSVLGVLGMEIEYFFFFESLQLQIILAVILMSLTGCKVFQNAVESHYDIEYLLGNFVLHYTPILVAFALAPLRKIDGTRQRLIAHVWSSLALFEVWLFFYRPWEVYGCDAIPTFVFTSMPLFLTVALNFMVLYFFGVQKSD